MNNMNHRNAINDPEDIALSSKIKLDSILGNTSNESIEDSIESLENDTN